MSAPNLATVELKAFVPARDFALSPDFYQALGFTLAWSSPDMAYLHHGSASFLLQNYYVREYAENFMMHLMVENVDHWHRHAVAQDLAGRFGVAIGQPEGRPWGIRDFTLNDPSGVLWRIGQELPDAEA